VPANGVALCPSGSCLGDFGAPGGSSERRLELSEASMATCVSILSATLVGVGALAVSTAVPTDC